MAMMIRFCSNQAAFRAFSLLCVACAVFLRAGISHGQSLQERPDDRRFQNGTALANASTPGKREMSRTELERELLLPLLLQERELLTHCGPDHPDLVAVQGKIAGVRDYLASIPFTSTTPPTTEPKATRWTKSDSTNYSIAQPAHSPAFEPPPSTQSAAPSGNIIQASHFSSEPPKARDRWDSSARTPTRSVEAHQPSWADSSTPKPEKSFEPSTGVSKVLATTATLLSPSEAPHPTAPVPEKQPVSLEQQARTLAEVVATMPSKQASPDGYFLRISWRQLICLLAIALCCLVLHLAGSYLIMRRCAARMAQIACPQPGFSQENSFKCTTGSGSSNPGDTETHQPHVGSFYTEKPPFDVSPAATLGPTWEEERQQKADEATRQGEAVLQQLFEQNMQLRKQLLVTAQGPENA